MIYITIAKDIDETIPERYRQSSKIFKNIISFIRCRLGIILEDKIDNKELLVLPILNKKIFKKIKSIINVRCIKNICLSNPLLENEEFMEFIKGQDVKVLDGRWLFNYLIPELVEYVVQNKKEILEYQEISLLTNELNDLVACNIMEIANNVKVLNIVTTRDEKFKKLERKIRKEQGIILNISNNYKKSLAKSDIIINFDFDEEMLNKYTLAKKTCIININEGMKINSKGFEGINASFYQIAIPRKYIKYTKFFKNFNEAILYESFIYKRTSVKNIINEIEKDGVYIAFLEGTKDKIRKNEYTKIAKNVGKV